MNDWNDRIEKTMVNLGCKCGDYRIMHDEGALYCRKIDSYISILSITLSTLTATGLFSLEDNWVIKIASGTVIYFIAFLSSMKQFLNYAEVAEQHKTYSMRFSVLYRDIQRQLCLVKKDRSNGKEYLTFVNNELDNLLFSNPPIPYRIKKNNLGDYNKNSTRERFITKDIYDIILDVDEPDIQTAIEQVDSDIIDKPEQEASQNTTPESSITHYSKYQINRFLSND